MKDDTEQFEVLDILYKLKVCWKTDLLLYMLSELEGTQSRISKYYQKLVKNEFIKEQIAYRPNKQKDRRERIFVELTEKGKNYLCNHENDKNYCVTTSVPHKERLLSVNRVKIMFHLAGALVFDKPTIEDLVTNKDDARKQLENGIYYSAAEIRNYFSDNEVDSDIYTRIKGALFTPSSTFAVYSTKYGETNILALDSNTNSKFLTYINELAKKFTSTFRNLSYANPSRVFNEDKTVSIDTSLYGQVECIIISDSDSLVYEMVMGNKHGRIKGKDMMEIYQGQRTKQTAKEMLVAGSLIYPRIYVTPHNLSGVDSLNYLCTTSIEEHIDISYKITLSMSDVTVIPNEKNIDPLYTGYHNKFGNVIFIPVYEVQELYRIVNALENIAIITKPEMAETIAHSIRRPNTHYYTIDENGAAVDSKDEITKYHKNGYPLGQANLENWLLKNGKCVSKKELAQLPNKFNLSSATFWNKVADSKIKYNDLLPCLTTIKEYEKPKRTRNSKRVGMHIQITKDLRDKAKERAAQMQVTVTTYITRLIYQDIKNNSEEILE